MMIAAVFALAASCTKPDDSPNEGNGTLTIKADKLEIVADGQDAAVITVEYDGKKITDGVSFYDMSNVPVAVRSMRFTTKSVGEHKFFATYEGAKSNTLTVKAVEFAAPEVPADPDPSGTSFRKRVLLTQFTSTGCTFCPIVVGLLRELSQDAAYRDRFVLAASHADMNGYQNGDDPASYPGVSGFMSAFKIQGYPTLTADLGEMLDAYDISKLKALVDGYYGDGTSDAGVSAASAVNGNTIVVRAAVKAGETGTYRVGAWLLEDGIYGRQTSAPDESYNTHNNCIRALDAGTSYVGHSVGKLASGDVADHIFTFKNTDSEWNFNNCKVLVYVTSSVGNIQVVNNAVVVPVGESAAFEYR